MDSSQYSTENRKQIKRDQRTPAYRELQRRFAEERTKLETSLRDRNGVIKRLSEKLAKAGFAEDVIADLSKLDA